VSRVPVAVLVSGSGTNLAALLESTSAADSLAEIVLVVADRHKAYGLQRARDAGVATEVVLKRDHPTPEAYDQALAAVLQRHGVEWVCLAGFMKLVGAAMLAAFPQRILNIHPSLLPAFPGLGVQQAAIEHGVRAAGATVHLVDGGMDTGPIVVQGVVEVHPDDSPEELSARILTKVEHRIYPMALRWAVQGKLRLRGRVVHVDTDEPLLVVG